MPTKKDLEEENQRLKDELEQRDADDQTADPAPDDDPNQRTPSFGPRGFEEHNEER